MTVQMTEYRKIFFSDHPLSMAYHSAIFTVVFSCEYATLYKVSVRSERGFFSDEPNMGENELGGYQ